MSFRNAREWVKNNKIHYNLFVATASFTFILNLNGFKVSVYQLNGLLENKIEVILKNSILRVGGLTLFFKWRVVNKKKITFIMSFENLLVCL